MKPGDKLGAYEILAPIGAGGMGEVYRARDTKLDREVAIKVLPAALAQHPDRLARFEREAKVLAALNHPNIAMIHGLEDRAIVMELVEGPTLADRLRSGPIPLEESLKIAAQIADALEAAHEKGVVHRDLKPANVKVRDDGTVKVLDFGLATAVQSGAGQPGDGANSPTLTMSATEAGVILGTAAYMSPEQAAGKPVDRRADIWSFGVVLWEMLTGKRLFEGETVSHTLADVLRAPIDFEKLPKGTPAPIRELLRRCLDRDIKTRLRDIGEARITIQRWVANPKGVTDSPARASSPPYGRAAWVVAVVATASALALGLVAYRQLSEEQPLVVNTTLLPPDGAEFDFGATYALPALSPDGTRIVFGAKSKDGKTQLYLRRLDSPSAKPLPGTEGAAFPFWSPDSRWVGFGQANKLKKIDIQGGPPATVADGVRGTFRGGSWNPEGVIVFGENNGSSIRRVVAAGGTAVPATPSAMRDGPGNGSPVYPWFLPDGRHFLYTSRQPGDIPVRVGSLDEPGKPSKVVAQAHSNAIYAQGHLLYLRENTLMAQPFDPERLETKGEAVPLAEGVPTYTSPSRGAALTVSAGGLLAYQTGGSGAGFRLAWKDRQGKALGNLGEPVTSLYDLALSPDGKSLAVVVTGQNADIWIYDTARGIPTRFTFNPGGARSPLWSPEGNTLYYASGRDRLDLIRKASNGSGAEELLLSDTADKAPSSVSPDGKSLLYQRLDPKTKFDLWVLPLAPVQSVAKPQPRVFLQTPFNENSGRFSPDGNWVAYLSDESGLAEVYVVPYPGPGGKRQISSGGARNLRWRGDGKELFYSTPSGELMAAEVNARSGTLEIGRVQKLFDGIIQNASTYSVSADGQKFLVVENIAGSGAARPLTLLQNWPAALRK